MADSSAPPLPEGKKELPHPGEPAPQESAASPASTTQQSPSSSSQELPSPSSNASSPITLKRPRTTDPVTHFLTPASASTASSAVSEGVSAAPTTAHPRHESDGAVVGVPPKQVRVEAAGSPVTPRSPYANLPRKVPRKTPASTPASSVGTPPLVSPLSVSPTGLSSVLTTPPQPSPPTAVAASSKLALMHERWANLLHDVLMAERAPHEAEAVRALALRIIQALPGDIEETKDGFQTLLVNMRDAKNGELRRQVVEGELLVEHLVKMDDRELANPELRKQIEDKMEERAKDTNLTEIAKSMRTSRSTLFKCKSCGARDSSWYQRQTRSGDEPMTVIITCNKCNKQWRQY